jgi:beta-phosphoglucomutase-like phosphatase (HAD superfamily)
MLLVFEDSEMGTEAANSAGVAAVKVSRESTGFIRLVQQVSVRSHGRRN